MPLSLADVDQSFPSHDYKVAVCPCAAQCRLSGPRPGTPPGLNQCWLMLTWVGPAKLLLTVLFWDNLLMQMFPFFLADLYFWEKGLSRLKILIITGNVLVCHFLRLVTSMGVLNQILMEKLCKRPCVGILLGWRRKFDFHVLRFGRWGSKVGSGGVAAPLVLARACEIHFQCSSPSLPLHRTGISHSRG